MSHRRGLVFGVLSLLVLGPWAQADERQPSVMGRLVYSRLTEGTWQIWMTDLSDGTHRQLTVSAGDKRYPALAPGQRISYQTSNQTTYFVDLARATEVPLFPDLWPIRDVAWSPDGLWVVFAKFRADVIDVANLWMAETSGTTRRMLTHDVGMQDNAAWSPDGSRLAYVSRHRPGVATVMVADREATTRQYLTEEETRSVLPAWSPDGLHIAYSADRTGDAEIWLMRADGSAQTQLTRAPGLDTRPAWSPDGTAIAFTTNRSGELEIWVMGADGSEQRPLIQVDGGACDPFWLG